MSAMGDQQAPRDYPAWDDERRLLINIIRRQAESGGGGYQEGGSNIQKWILGLLLVLVPSTIIGAVTLYGRFTSLETAFLAWQTSSQRQMDATNARVDRLEGRRP